MALSKRNKPALILVDIQQGFNDPPPDWGARNNPDAEKKAGQLLDLWRQLGLPIFHVQHCSTESGSRLVEGRPGHRFQDLVRPRDGEPIVKKNVNSAFIGTNLKEQLDNARITQLVIVGLTTDHCISTTARMAGNLGYDTYLVGDATATFDKKGLDGKMFPASLIHDTALASLQGEFVTVVKTSEVEETLQELL